MPSATLIAFDYEWRPLQNYLQEQGISAPHLPAQRKGQLPSEILYDWIVSNCSSAAEGLKLGEFYNISDYGAAGLALLSSATSADALNVIRAYMLIFNRDIADIRVEHPSLGEVGISISVNSRPGWAAESCLFHTNVVASGAFKLLRALHGSDFEVTGLTLPARPGSARLYEDYFDVPVRLFGSNIVIHIPADQMERKIRTANPAVFEIALAMANESFTKLLEMEMGGIRQRVVSLLKSLPEPFPDIQSVALHLKLTERTLRRRLAEEGCGYRQIVDESRHQKARQLLTLTHLRIEQISEMLGYADVSSFRHAFRRWTGYSINTFKRETRQDN
ncbi:helix-turn-helix transcriptional regulator [Pseudomonas sp. RA_35y_Pfl2_P32]|uniref:helix-turn-helix transcriptional regulator n=1 Tax=Pseudomonas sp. RA_35y_Pfl2_P32 TaxID=3088705 RepID=UPI0030D744DA